MDKKLKKEARVIGIDDAPFIKGDKKKVLVAGVIYRGGNYLDGVVSCKVKIDGEDATEKISEMINKSKFKPQLQIIFLKGISVAGFNVINVFELSEKTKLPIIIVMRDYPNYKKIYSALKIIKQEHKIKLIREIPKPLKVEKIYIQYINTTLAKTKEWLKITCIHSFVPEPIRVAHIIARGVVSGESRGRT